MKTPLSLLMILLTSAALIASTGAVAAKPGSPVTFRLVSGLPRTLQVGDSAAVTVEISSDQEFTQAQAMPDDQYPGKGVVASHGDRSGAGTQATLTVTFTAAKSTASLPDGEDLVAVVAGIRFPNGQTVSQRFDFSVTVP
jgi:hypothetical protein